jgi:hypothetical protein
VAPSSGGTVAGDGDFACLLGGGEDFILGHIACQVPFRAMDYLVDGSMSGEIPSGERAAYFREMASSYYRRMDIRLPQTAEMCANCGSRLPRNRVR